MSRFVVPLLCAALGPPALVAATPATGPAARPPATAPAKPSTTPAPVKPTAHNTGPVGALREVRGDVDITEDGAVVRDVDVRGAIHVRADNVRLLNFRARRVKFFDEPDNGGHRNLLVEDGEISDPSGGTGITGGHMIVRRTEVHHMGADAFNVHANTLLEANYAHHLGMDPASHADGVSGTSPDGKPVTGVVIRGNHFDMPSHARRGVADARPQHCGFNANGVIFLGLFGTKDNPTLVEHNWLNGGNYTVTSGLPGAHVVYRHNRFGRDYNWGLARTHDKRQRFTKANWTGNVWDDTSRPANPTAPRRTEAPRTEKPESPR